MLNFLEEDPAQTVQPRDPQAVDPDAGAVRQLVARAQPKPRWRWPWLVPTAAVAAGVLAWLMGGAMGGEAAALRAQGVAGPPPPAKAAITSEWPVKVAAPGGRVLWRAGAAGEIEKSEDGGATWTPQTSGTSAGLLGGGALSDKLCWIVGKDGTVLRTTDGQHWIKLPFPSHGDLGSVTPKDDRIAVVWVIQDKITYVTFDGGSTWIPTDIRQ